MDPELLRIDEALGAALRGEDPEEVRERAAALREEGHSYEEIARMVGRSAPSVYAWCNPGKSDEQVRRWSARHHPELAEAEDPWR